MTLTELSGCHCAYSRELLEKAVKELRPGYWPSSNEAVCVNMIGYVGAANYRERQAYAEAKVEAAFAQYKV